MTSKKIIRTGLISTIAMLASNNAVFAMSCASGIDGFCLTDGNAKFSIKHDDVNFEYGMDMSVDGNTQTWVLDFMIDNPNAAAIGSYKDKGVDIPIYPTHLGTEDYLSTGGITTEIGTNELNIEGKTVSDYGTVDLNFKLNYIHADAATLIQTFTFENTSGATLTDLSFLALTDISLGGFGNGFNDEGALTTFDGTQPTGYKQWSNNGGNGGQEFELNASVNVAVDEYEVSVADATTACSDINDPGVGDLCYRAKNHEDLTLTNAVDSPAGGEDIMMAARWLRTLAHGETFTYTQTFSVFDQSNPISDVPVPAAVWLFGSGLIGLIGVGRRKQSLKA